MIVIYYYLLLLLVKINLSFVKIKYTDYINFHTKEWMYQKEVKICRSKQKKFNKFKIFRIFFVYFYEMLFYENI